MKIFDEIALKPCDILIPDKNVNYEKWAVVACDQYTSEPEYWEKVFCITKGNPSTLDIIFPEVYLETCDNAKKISEINKKMQEYIDSGIFTTVENSFILVNRTFPSGICRKGLIAAVDLEAYDYQKGSVSLIRATEGTVLERIPPRVKIRENAPLELPHVMLLIDDPQKTVIEPLFQSEHEILYDFDLMMNSGHITGYRISGENDFQSVASSLKNIRKNGSSILYAVGDGNHSLASAKAHWENVKRNLSSEELISHPARFALAEIVNVHDDGIIFEPIHRICTGIDPKILMEDMEKYFSEMPAKDEIQKITAVYGDHCEEIEIKNPVHMLEVGSLQAFLDYEGTKYNLRTDYIHGSDVVRNLAQNPDSTGFILPAMSKNMLFKSVETFGALPPKTFSMGEACEKRFYLECRKITK